MRPRSFTVVATALVCACALGCGSGRTNQPKESSQTGGPASTGGYAEVDPYNADEIPPEELEFPEPPGEGIDEVPEPAGDSATAPSGDQGKSSPATSKKVPELSLGIPDVSESIPMLPPSLEPRGREGIVGLSNRGDVVDKFDMPTRMESGRFVYTRHRSFSDFKQVVFRFEVNGRLTQVDLFPSMTITRQQVIERYGGGFSRKASGSYEIMNYRRRRLIFFLKAATDTVYSIRLKK